MFSQPTTVKILFDKVVLVYYGCYSENARTAATSILFVFLSIPEIQSTYPQKLLKDCLSSGEMGSFIYCKSFLFCSVFCFFFNSSSYVFTPEPRNVSSTGIKPYKKPFFDVLVLLIVLVYVKLPSLLLLFFCSEA